MVAARAMAFTGDEVVVLHDPELLVAAIPLAIVRRRTTFVFDLHENLPKQMRTRFRYPSILRPALSLCSRWVLHIAEGVMVVTLAEPQYATLFRRSHPVFENLPVVDSLPMRAEDARGVVYVGDITVERGASLLVEAVSILGDVPLLMIGRCSDGLNEQLQRRAEVSGVDLTLTGYLPYHEAWLTAARSLVGVSPLLDLPNYRNSLPTKLLEYRSVGLIAVASDLPGSVEALDGSSVAKTFSAGDARSLATALREALVDVDSGRLAIEEADEVRRRWSWDAGGFGDFFEDLVTGAR